MLSRFYPRSVIVRVQPPSSNPEKNSLLRSGLIAFLFGTIGSILGFFIQDYTFNKQQRLLWLEKQRVEDINLFTSLSRTYAAYSAHLNDMTRLVNTRLIAGELPASILNVRDTLFLGLSKELKVNDFLIRTRHNEFNARIKGINQDLLDSYAALHGFWDNRDHPTASLALIVRQHYDYYVFQNGVNQKISGDSLKKVNDMLSEKNKEFESHIRIFCKLFVEQIK